MNVTYLQTSFLGGEWSPYSQGRAENETYRTGMNLCRNTIPIEEGAATRRAGLRQIAPTYLGQPAAVRAFHFEEAQPYVMEFTPNFLRFSSGATLVQTVPLKLVTDFSDADPAVITVVPDMDWVDGDEVVFTLANPDTLSSSIGRLLNRPFKINVLTTKTFELYDALTGESFSGGGIALDDALLMVGRVLRIDTPYVEDMLPEVRVVQAGSEALILQGNTPPYLLTATSQPAADEAGFATFDLAQAKFTDGPYLDPTTTGGIITPSAVSGTITLTLSYPAYSALVTYFEGQYVVSGGLIYRALRTTINDTPVSSPNDWEVTTAPDAFDPLDVGRMVRLFSEPLAWDVAHTYAAKDTVKYQDAYWIAVAASTGVIPGTDVTKWLPQTNLAKWSWGKIAAYSSATVVSLDLMGVALPYTNPIYTWRMGLIGSRKPSDGCSCEEDSILYPTCGVYYRGRLWLSGMLKNRVDASVANDIFNFAPSDENGTVADSSGIAALMQSTDAAHTIQWMAAGRGGIICGTPEGEAFVSSTTFNQPITPTAINAEIVTDYGCANVEPVQAGLSLVFVQNQDKKILEYLSDASSGRFAGSNIGLRGKHLTAPGLIELTYQHELAPVVWARMKDNTLAGCSYKRESPFASQEPNFAAWHRHDHGGGFDFTGLTSGPAPGGKTDAITVVTYDPDADLYYLEVMASLFDQDTPIWNGWFLDNSVNPAVAYMPSANSLVIEAGLWTLVGKAVDVTVGGLWVGNFTVGAGGTITVPVDGATNPLTLEYMQTVSASGDDFNGLGTTIVQGTGTSDPGPDLSGLWPYYPPEDSGYVVYSSESLLCDFDNNRAFVIFWDNPSAGTRNVEAFDLDKGGFGYRGVAAVNENGPPWTLVAGRPVSAYSNNPADAIRAVSKYDGKTLRNLGTFGANGAGTVTSAAGLAVPGSMVPSAGCENMLISVSRDSVAPSTKAEVALVKLDTMTWWGTNYALNQAHGIAAPGVFADELGTSISETFFLGYASLASPTTASVELYRGLLTCDTFTLSSIATLAPAGIDPAWTHISAIGGMVTDEHDYCPIFAVSTTDAVTNKNYLVKLNRNTGAVKWKCAVNALPNQFSWPTRFSQGSYGFVSSLDNDFYLIDTIAGTATHTNLTGVVLTGVQQYDGSFQSVPDSVNQYGGRLVGGYTLTQGAGTPNNEVDGQDYTNLFSAFSRQTFPPNILRVPIGVGYSFTSQGQILRPIAQNEAGTQQGPALAKTRREQQFGLLVHRSGYWAEFGTTFDHLRPAQFSNRPDGGTPIGQSDLKSGIHWNTLDDDYNYDSMFCWSVAKPVPLTILAVGNFLAGQDR